MSTQDLYLFINIRLIVKRLLFLTSKNPEVAASHLDNLRLNKMILETAQLLSSACRRLYRENENLYKDTHLNHPCAIWARKSEENYKWLLSYFLY